MKLLKDFGLCTVVISAKKESFFKHGHLQYFFFLIICKSSPLKLRCFHYVKWDFLLC